MKIAELINSYDQISKKRKYNSFEKQAFVPNPTAPPPQDPAAMQQQPAAQPPAGMQQAQASPPPQAAPQTAPAPQLPPEAAQLDASGDGSLLDELTAAIQQMPPEMQQQLAAMLQQVQQLPPEQKEMQLFQILTQLQGGAGQPQPASNSAPPQQPPAAPQTPAPPQDPAAGQGGGMVAQADEYSPDYEQLMAALQQQGQDEQGSDDGSQEIQQAENSANETTNELDNVKVTLSVRELLDLVGKGTATASLLKVKQLADTHQQKMDQSKQKAEAANQKQQQAQQQPQGVNSGGIYPTPMNGG